MSPLSHTPVPPQLYSRRFVDFVNKKVFAVDDPPVLGHKRQKARRRLNQVQEDIAEGEEEEELEEEEEEDE